MDLKIIIKDHKFIRGGKTLIKYNDQEIVHFLSDLNFYDFQHLCSMNGFNVKIEFSTHYECLTYNDLDYGSNIELFEQKQELILTLINFIFDLARDKDCLIKKYNECWILNKKKSKVLNKLLRKNNVKNKGTAGILICKTNYEIKLFVRSILKYNSFVQFIFLKEEIVISVTDHMDIFISFANENFMQKLLRQLQQFNSKYNKSEKNSEIFTILKI